MRADVVTTLTAALVLCMFATGTSAEVRSERVLETYKTHPCMRKCRWKRPMTCEYDFTVEYYYVLSAACYDCPKNKTDCYRPQCVPADGTSRPIMVVNRMLPGPPIQVCEKDRVIIRVHNELTGAEGTSIHWHGIRQRGSPHMDGVSLVTQCPIHAESSFEYRFKADDAGTHFWHAHSGPHRADGIFGAFVVRQADEREPHLGLYDADLPEHTILVNDWTVELTVNTFAKAQYAGGNFNSPSILINGHGMFQEFFDNTDNTTSYTPVEVFHVTRGKRYRFRVINNGVYTCPIQISIDNHMLTMIASDGYPFEKVTVDSFNIFAGERFDFVLDASQPRGNYWIRARGQLGCATPKAKQVAILRYNRANEEDPAGGTSWEDADRQGTQLNPVNKKSSDELITMADLVNKNPVSDNSALRPVPDKKFYLAMNFNTISDVTVPQINHISNILPPSPPLTQLKDLDEDMFCDHLNMLGVNCSAQLCQCVHRLQVAIGDVVELVLIDEGRFNLNHPKHLHGNNFYVVGMDRLGTSTSLEEVKQLDEQGLLPRNLTNPVQKDTVTVSDGGYTILRFYADNPGFWYFHCHIEFHTEIGMSLFFQVGKRKDFPKTPKNFPKCGSWKYTKDADESVP